MPHLEPVRTPSTMFSGTAPTPGRQCVAARYGIEIGYPVESGRWAASTKNSVLPRNSPVRRIGIGPASRGGPGEIQIGLNGAEVPDDVCP